MPNLYHAPIIHDHHSPTMQAYNLTCAHYNIIYPLIKLDFSLIQVSLFLPVTRFPENLRKISRSLSCHLAGQVLQLKRLNIHLYA